METEMEKRSPRVLVRGNSAGQKGFTMVETAVALVVMMVVGLGAASLFFYALRANSNARDRELAMAVAQEQLERLRSTSFSELEATVSETGGNSKSVTSAGRQYTVATTVANTVTGDATLKTITIQVTPAGVGALSGVQRIFGGVTLVTQRATNSLGSNRSN